MSDNPEIKLDPFSSRDKATAPMGNQNGPHTSANGQLQGKAAVHGGAFRNDGGTAPAAEFFLLVESLARRWIWILGSGLAFGLGGFLLGMHKWETHYSARAQLVLYDASHVSEVFRPKPFLIPSLPKLIQSPQVMQRLSEKTHPPIPPDALARNIKVIPERNGDFATVAFSGPDLHKVVEIVNQYAQEAILFTQELQAREAAEVEEYLKAQQIQTEQELTRVNQKFRSLLETSPKSAMPRSSAAAWLEEKLGTAREELLKLLIDFKEGHPAVDKKVQEIKVLEQELAKLDAPPASNSTDLATGPSMGSSAKAPEAKGGSKSLWLGENRPDVELVRSQVQSLEHERLSLLNRQHAAHFFTQSPVGFYRLYAPALLENVVTHGRGFKILLLAIFSTVVGMGAAAALALLREILDDRLKTREDVRRVTGLPILAAIGDLSQVEESVRAHLGFRTWLSMRKRLNFSSNGGAVCGLMFSHPEEACSSWLRFLAQAASACGCRVLTIATNRTEATAARSGVDVDKRSGADLATNALVSRSADLLACTTDVAERLEGPNAQPIVDLLVPEWAWKVQAHPQWQAALDLWGQIDNLVIFIEMPPASSHDAVLLAQRLANVIWLTTSGKAKAAQTIQHIEVLEQAGCRLVGAVLDNETPSAIRNFLPKWRGHIRETHVPGAVC